MLQIITIIHYMQVFVQPFAAKVNKTNQTASFTHLGIQLVPINGCCKQLHGKLHSVFKLQKTHLSPPTRTTGKLGLAAKQLSNLLFRATVCEQRG